MSWTSNFTDDAVDLVADTWPSVGVIVRTTEMNAIPWETLVTEGINGSGPLRPPFAVVALGKYEDWPEYAPLEGDSFRVPFAAYYVDMKSGGTGADERLETLGATLMEALRRCDREYFYVPTQPTFDASDGNPPNRVFAGQGNHPLLAVEVRADLLVRAA